MLQDQKILFILGDLGNSGNCMHEPTLITDIANIMLYIYSLFSLYVLCHLDDFTYKRFYAYLLLTFLMMSIRFNSDILNLIFVILGCVALVLIIFFKKSINKT